MSPLLGWHPTDEQRAVNSASHMGQTPWNKGIPMTEEQKVVLSTANMGKPSWNKGIPMTDEQKVKCSPTQFHSGHPTWNKGIPTGKPAWNRGIPMTDEARKKVSEALMGHPSPNKGKPTSDETKVKLSTALKGRFTGASSNNWKGGVTSEAQLARKSPEYVAWRTAVFERDHYTCRDCGAHAGTGHTVRFEAHHIHEFAQYLDERFVVDNGKTLCLECHNKTKGRKARVSA